MNETENKTEELTPATQARLVLPPSDNVQAEPEPPLSNEQRAIREWTDAGEYHRAISAAEALLARNPDDAALHNELGVLYYNINNREKALQQFKIAVHQNSGNNVFRRNLADCYLAEQKYDDAKRIYERILAITPDNIEVLLTLGHIAELRGQPDSAIEYYRKTAAIDPKNESAVQKLYAMTSRAMTTTKSTDFQTYLSDLPLLHTWDGGKTWNSGGFNKNHLKQLHDFLKKNLPAAPRILETGAGNSTITFLFLSPSRVVSIAPDTELFSRIRGYCSKHTISAESLEPHASGSEWVLPAMAARRRDASLAGTLPKGFIRRILARLSGWTKAPADETLFDFVLIDGCHNWPMVFVDFFYANYLLKTGGYIMIDDVQLHSVKELARMITEQPGFQLALDLEKSLVFRRTSAEQTLGEWGALPYIVRKSNEYANTNKPYAL